MTTSGPDQPEEHAAASAASEAGLDISPASELVRRLSTGLAESRLGLAVMALVVGAAAGLGAAFFRWLIVSVTWVATGYPPVELHQQPRIG
jgi:hypothetical protein